MAKNKKLLKKKNKEKTKKKSVLHSETKRSIAAIICFTLSVLAILSFLEQAGAVGGYFSKISRLFFGRAVFLVPLALVLIGLAVLRPVSLFGESKGKSSYRAAFLGVAVFVLSILGIFHLLIPSQSCSDLTGLKTITCGLAGGGYLGAVIGYPLSKFVGFWAGLIILLALLIISVLIAFNISLSKKKEKMAGPEGKIEFVGEIKGEKKISQKEESIGLFSSIGRKIKETAKIGLGQKKGPAPDKGLAVSQPVSPEEKGMRSIIAANRGKLPKTRIAGAVSNFKLPPLDFLEKDKGHPTSGDIKANINIIKRTLVNFGIEVEMAEVNIGPTVTQYTLRPAQGIKLSKITALQNDLALALAAHPLRIEAPIPGRSLVGIEIPNRVAVLVRLRDLLEDETFKNSSSLLTFALGRDVAGNPIYANLARMPHLLVAGATGTGKTVGLNNIILSLLFQNFPEFLKLILIDPKRVEFIPYNEIPHLLTPVIVRPDKAVFALRWAVSEMERRFEVLQTAGCRDIAGYNTHQIKTSGECLPYIVIAIDELADLMASQGREVEASIVRLAQMARAVGIHLIVATQRPSVEVITGLIKANITSRVAFQVASQVDSRTILDMAGAEKLLGNGDMLYLSADASKPRRIQGAYVSEKEIKKVTDYLKDVCEPDYKTEVVAGQASQIGGSFADLGADDELYEEAKEVIIQAGKASASLLQRRLRVGYARAARLLDIMEEKGVVGPADGAKPRDVFVDKGEEEEI